MISTAKPKSPKPKKAPPHRGAKKSRPKRWTRDQFIQAAMQKQHDMVGVEYSPEACKVEGWYTKHTWTKEQELEFRAWYIETATKHTGLEVAEATMSFAWWNLAYGWRLEP